MNRFRLLLVLSFLLLINQVEAQQSVNLTQKLNRLLTVIYDNHIQAAEIDENFIEDFQQFFLESIDPLEVILTKTESAQIESNAKPLAGNIRLKGSDFVDSSFILWKQGAERSKRIYEKLIIDKIDVTTPVDSLLFTERVDANQIEEKWRAFLRLEVISEAASLAYSDDELRADQSRCLDSAQFIVKQELEDYFSMLDDYREIFEEDFLRSIAESFDPHTTYFTNSGYEEFKEELSGERQLFGISYNRNSKGQLFITSLMPGSSAWLSGEIHSGDILLKIDFGNSNSFSLKGKTAFQLGKMFEDYAEDEITLTLKTGVEDAREVTLYKTKVYSDSDVIKAAVLNGKKPIGYISLPDFYTNWENEQGLGCANDVAKAIVKLKKQSVEGIILDLRNNGGGSLREAVDLAGIFLNYGPILISDDGSEKPYTIKDMNRGLIFSGPLVIMVNEYSASASEVLSAALQDHNRALIVGGRTYGKATGQSFVPLTTNESNLMSASDEIFGYAKVTRSALYRINLFTNQAVGVIPDLELPMSGRREGHHEEDYPTVLRFDSISKKMYFTPMPELAIGSVSETSRARLKTDTATTRFNSFQAESDALRDRFDPFAANYEDWLKYVDSLAEIKEKQNSLLDNYKVSFNPEALKFDSEIFEMDEVLQMYNERFLERLQSDIDLSETYLIINELTKN